MARFLDEEEVKITPYGSNGTHVNGLFVGEATTPYYITVSIQPLPGGMLKSLPEGQRMDATYVMLTDGPDVLNFMDPLNNSGSDIVTIDDIDYYLIAYENWTRHTNGLKHNKYVCVENTQS